MSQPQAGAPVRCSVAGGAIGIVLKGWPRLSETFIAQEVLALERRGFNLALFSLRHPTDAATHPWHASIRARVTYLPEYLHEGVGRVWRAFRIARRLPGYCAARSAWWRDLRRDPSRNRVRRFGQALVLAAELPADVVHLHAHFLHTPASVARYAAMLRNIGWSCSAHAKDIWTIPEWEKREKLCASAWTATCTAANAQHLRKLAPSAAHVDLVYHGIDTDRFPAPADRRQSTADGSHADAPVTLLSVGRAVDKKGLDDLLRALARLPRVLQWQLLHVGEGPLLPSLRKLATTLGIAERVQWCGALAHADVLAAYRRADVFVLPSRISANGDRDGLPNVLLEAQSQRVACVSTTVSGIPELIIDGVTGLLVEPRSPAALAEAIGCLIRDPQLRQRLADAGFERTTQVFSLAAGADALARKFTATLEAA